MEASSQSKPGVCRQVRTASSTTLYRVLISPFSSRANAQNVPGGRQICGWPGS
ncbi:SPOR domain-containing protein [Streptomyces sp. NPDC058632]|uniref:SPOR domain-containing protein n=1 Tax=Streptomyces sp. NPDC058632 TaxID=3346567 RepID=UPI003655839F